VCPTGHLAGKRGTVKIQWHNNNTGKKKSSPAFVISRSISTSFNPQKLVL